MMTNTNEPIDPHGHEPMQEGEEAPPPYVHTAAIVRWAILGVMSLFALIMILNYFGLTGWASADAGPTQYHCPMHPTYVSNQPGDCPICGMSLVPIPKNAKDSAAVTDSHAGHDMASDMGTSGAPKYYCPMDPEIVSDTMGTCSKCGMKLEQVPVAKPGQYICSMDPQIVSDTAGRCPICKMFLEKVPEPSSSHSMKPDDGEAHDMLSMPGMPGMAGSPDVGARTDRDMGSSPVPGLVPVTIDPERLQLIGIRTGKVERRVIGENPRLVGFVTPDESKLASISVRFSGWVKELFADQTGQAVSAGQPLLSVYSQDLFQAEQDYLIAREANSRVATDVSLAGTRRLMLDAARQRLQLLGVPEQEMARLDTEKKADAELTIRSPFSGYVLEKGVVAGQFIGPDQALFKVADLSRVWVLADVYERDLANVRLGQTVHMTTSAYAGASFEGVISFIYPSVAEQTRTLKIRIEFPNPSLALKPGMYAEIDLADLGSDQGSGVLAVLADAVMDGGDRQYAFVVHDGTHFEPRLLKLGRRSDDYFEVLAGLSGGEQVVTSANFLIDSESRLKAAIAGMGGTEPNAHAGHGK